MPGNGQMSAKVLLVTGGIGAGKSAVSRMLIERGVPVYFSDDMAKSLYGRDASLRDSLRRLFGERVFRDGDVDRRALAELIFADEEKRRALEALVHPAVFRDFEESGIQWMESAILFESGINRLVDKVVMVSAPDEVRINRVMSRDHISREKVMQWMQRQWSQEKVRQLSDFEIVNDGIQPLEPQIETIIKQLAYKS